MQKTKSQIFLIHSNPNNIHVYIFSIFGKWWIVKETKERYKDVLIEKYHNTIALKKKRLYVKKGRKKLMLKELIHQR